MKTLIGLLMMASASVASADLIPFDQFLGFQDVERGVPQIQSFVIKDPEFRFFKCYPDVHVQSTNPLLILQHAYWAASEPPIGSVRLDIIADTASDTPQSGLIVVMHDPDACR